MDTQKLESLRSQLTSELKAVDHQLKEYGATVEGEGIEVSMDEGFADSASATAERASVLGLVEQLQATRVQLAAALERIDEGTFGKCEKCGQEIPVERLEALPSTRLCVSCKQSA